MRRNLGEIDKPRQAEIESRYDQGDLNVLLEKFTYREQNKQSYNVNVGNESATSELFPSNLCARSPTKPRVDSDSVVRRSARL